MGPACLELDVENHRPAGAGLVRLDARDADLAACGLELEGQVPAAGDALLELHRLEALLARLVRRVADEGGQLLVRAPGEGRRVPGITLAVVAEEGHQRASSTDATLCGTARGRICFRIAAALFAVDAVGACGQQTDPPRERNDLI